MSTVIDVYWSFRSPYSYLVTPDLLQLRDDYDVDVHLRPVFPIAIRTKGTLFDDESGKQKVGYILMDMMRRAEMLGMPLAFPNPDPIVQDMKTFTVADDQPFIYRLTALGVEAEKQGKGIEAAAVIARLIWGGTKDWDQGTLLADALASVGLDLAAMEEAMQHYDWQAVVEHNHEALNQAGHWGVPTMVLNGEPFFGQDRIDTLRWRLNKLGLRKQTH